jgi:hypothetical protein
MRTIALFLMFTVGMFAADRRSIAEVGEKVDRATAKAMWARADSLLNTTTFPQAPGILSVLTSGAQYQIDFTTQTLPAGSSVGGEIIDPNGEEISTDTYYFSEAVNGGVFMELWNGAFPQGWPAGITRFRMLVTTAGGTITEANAYVAVRSCCTNGTAPQVTSITPSSNGSQLTITGQFYAAPMVGINGTPVQVISGVTTFSATTGALQGTIVIPNIIALNDGNGVLTLCDQGYCSQTFFNIPLPFTNGKG